MGDIPWTKLIEFRNPGNLGAVIAQIFLILSSFLVICGLLYIVLVVIIITFHHFLYDRDPKRVPAYVKQSIQFSSDESYTGSNHSKVKASRSGHSLKSRSNSKSGSKLSVSGDRDRHRVSNSMKGQMLDKFLEDANQISVQQRTTERKHSLKPPPK